MAREAPHVQQWLVLTRTAYMHPKVLNTFAVQFARRLPNISALVIFGDRGSDHHTNIHPLTFAALSSFRSITTLWLWECKFRTFSDFQMLIHAFPKLSTLIRGICSWLHTPQSTVNTHPTRPRLASLVVYNLHTRERSKTYSWLSCTPSTTDTVRNMFLPFPRTGEDHPSVDSLIEAVGPSLTELRFPMYGTSLWCKRGQYFVLTNVVRSAQ